MQWDFEKRTYEFAKSVRLFVRDLPRNVYTQSDIQQVIRSSGSIAANYYEANDALGKQDFSMRLKISRKEAKETILWLKLLQIHANEVLELKRLYLEREAIEIKSILSAMINKHNVSNSQ